MRLIILVALMGIGLSGCATPAGWVADADFTWRAAMVAASAETIKNRLALSQQQCDAKLFFEWSPLPGIGKSMADVYLPTLFGGRSDWVLGRLYLTENNENATLRARRGSDVCERGGTKDGIVDTECGGGDCV